MVIGVIAIVLGVLMPALGHSRHLAKQAACKAGLQQVGVALHAYSVENRGHLPYGPKAPPPSATNFYPQTGNVTSLISLQSGAPVGLGLLLRDHLPRAPEVLFCPGADLAFDTAAALAKVGKSQVEGSYYYRHASVATLSGKPPPPRMQLDRLGTNRRGAPIRCLVMDTQFIAPQKMAMFNLSTKTHHRQKMINALYTDGHVSGFENTNDRYTVNVSLSVYQTLDRILQIFELLDSENLN